MANINLNNFFRKSTDVKSPVDSKIQINKAETDKEYYGDLRLDLQIGQIKERELNADVSNNDIQRICNEESILTSLRNIFNTYSCSRLLNPEVSFDVKQYLFEPITSAKAWFLGYDICQTLPMYEPRIKLTNVEILGNADDHSYVIKLKILIPSLGKEVDIKSLLNSDGYAILG